jgi:hypothetical protein
MEADKSKGTEAIAQLFLNAVFEFRGRPESLGARLPAQAHISLKKWRNHLLDVLGGHRLGAVDIDALKDGLGPSPGS